ncbi:adenomatous polyposis coli protein-like isoform X2 [Prorops nasuta]|uniref:adenomatous polyposis coli protein-like isoform X2 n=1 Tax=Prorops nasuta TaxID=863751 RepID=UPI0034D00414
MPGESREPSVTRQEISLEDPRSRGISPVTMIPVPRTGQFSSLSQNPKSVKTERNRLRLIMDGRDADAIDKERRISLEEAQHSQENSQQTRARQISRYVGRSNRKEQESEERALVEGVVSRLPSRRGAGGGEGRGNVAQGSGSSSCSGTGEWCPLGLDLADTDCHEFSARSTLEFDASAATRTASSDDLGLTSKKGRCANTHLNAVQHYQTNPKPPSPPLSVHLQGVSGTFETTKEDAMEPEIKEEDERRAVTSSPEVYTRSSRHYNENISSEDDKAGSPLPSQRVSCYRGTWPIRKDLWANQLMGLSTQHSTPTTMDSDMASVMSFSSHSDAPQSSSELRGQHRLGTKVDVVYNLLGMLGSAEGREDMSTTLLSMSNSVDSCLVMRQSGCLPLLVQLIHAPGQDPVTRERVSRALHNVVHAKSDERAGRREARVLRFLEQLRDYCQALRISLETGQAPDDFERHPSSTIAALMKLSFDEAHRHAMCQLGGLHAVAELIEMDHMAHGSECDDQNCITLRRYAGMALTNLTFGDGNNKALLCSFREFMKALVSQLRSPSDDLRQVTASVLRNLSWRADSSSKQTLREVGAVTGLMRAAMEGRKESALKSILSALWNLSAHCSTNKLDICSVDGAVAFLVDMLSYKAPSKTLAIVENAGGILRNVSSYIALRDDYRAILRERGCLQVLLQQLRSPSLTVVSNACGALWNLSARCPQDQRLLWDLGAVPMLRSLVHSKHKMISMGSSAALKNLLSARPNCGNLVHLDSTARGLGLTTLPSLVARRQKALEQELDQNLSETCDNIEPSTSPTTKDEKFAFKEHSFLGVNARLLRSYQIQGELGTSKISSSGVPRSESRESMRSVTSTHSDTMFERVNRHVLNGVSPTELQIKQQSSSLHSAVGFDHGLTSNVKPNTSEKKYALRYKNAENLRPAELSNLRCTNSTISWSSAIDQEAACSQIINSSIEDNLSSINQSLLSSTKADSQSSISDDPEAGISYHNRRTNSRNDFDASGSSNYEKIYTEKLNTIKKAISPITSNNPDNDFFSCYAETDLDEPTDYSLRYAERVVEEDEKEDSAYFTSVGHEDTIKTYCTEGTPYETSLNTSRTASSTDLQEDGRNKSLCRKILEQKYQEDSRVDGLKCSVGEESTLNESSVRTTPIHVISIDSSGYHGDDIGSFEGETDICDKENSFVHNEAEMADHSDYGAQENESIDQVSDGDEEDDEDLLAACINIGMQNSRHRHSFIGNNFDKAPTRTESNLTRYQTSVALDQVDSNTNVDHAKVNMRNQLDKCENRKENSIDKRYSLNIQLIGESTSIQNSSLSESSSMNDENPVENRQTESDVSLDTVEQSEQALLKACILPEMPQSKDSVSSEESSSLDKESILVQGCNDSEVEKVVEEASISTILEAVETTTSGTKPVVDEIYRRQRDPDAMMASLDRLTVTLVQQSEAIRESTTMKQSTLSDTWNEDSPNEVSFPSISISAPLIASFRSDVQEDEPTILSDIAEDEGHPQFPMESSKIIEQEAIKLAKAVDAEVGSHHDLEVNSITSIDIEAIRPPSTMGSLISLTASYAGATESPETLLNNRDRCHSTSLPPSHAKNHLDGRFGRKKSLPVGVVAKRAIGHHQNHAGSLENLLNECTNSRLENVKPPSMMDDLDIGDMENSMVSVASITSEVADSKDQDSHSLTGSDPMFDLLKPVANVLSIQCMRYAEAMQTSANNSLSECLENINPPSLFNEVSEMDESTLEAATDTLCSDTICADVELRTEEVVYSMMVGTIDEDENDTDEALTPLSTEYCLSSSAESTPKKRPSKTHLTPKQKRTLAKERYKTYTIAAELVKKNAETMKQEANTGTNEVKDKIQRGKCSPFSKLTPKQRRQEDRARFQTQVLANPFPIPPEDKLKDLENGAEEKQGTTENMANVAQLRSAIPMMKKIPVRTTLMKKRVDRVDNKNRYRTRTLNDVVSLLKNGDSGQGSDMSEDKQEEFNFLERNGLINHTNESNKTTTGYTDDSVLDCETLSFASNDDSESALRLKFMNGLSNKLLVSCVQDDVTYTIESNGELQLGSSSQMVEQEALNNEETESGNESGSNDEQQQRGEPRGPRIIKPGMVRRDASLDSNLTDKSDPDSPKAIRGRRKALYSNPITRKPTPQSSPSKQVNSFSGIPIGRSNTSPIVRATRATTLRQNNNSQQSNAKSIFSPKVAVSDDTKTKNVIAARRVSVPQKGSSSTIAKSQKRYSTPPTYGLPEPKTPDTPTKPLERQGTFTKDEPEVENAPTVVSAQSSPVRTRIAKPIKSISSKVYPASGKSKISVRTYQAKINKSGSTERIQTGGLPVLVAAKRPGAQGSGKIGGQVIQEPASKGVKKASPLDRRSNSNASIVSNVSTGATNRRSTKEATSKIASLWKKVEETKNRQRFEKPDTRRWIKPEGKQAESVDTEEESPAYRLFRSSTFEGISQCDVNNLGQLEKSKSNQPLVNVQSNGVKYRNSCDLSGMDSNEAPCKIAFKPFDSSTYKKKSSQNNESVVLRRQQSEGSADSDPTKRMSRLGSFISVDPSNPEGTVLANASCVTRIPASAIVTPFNYNPKQDIPSQSVKVVENHDGKFEITECPTDIVTSSARVTTV